MKNLIYIILALAIYIVLSILPVCHIVIAPIGLLCTFLHEFGHAIAAVLTGGHVSTMQVNLDGSGVTTTSGGYFPLIVMGGYIGSAVFGNILLRLSMSKFSTIALIILAIAMLVPCLIWFDNLTTTISLALFSFALFGLSQIPKASSPVLVFLGIASIIYIIQDFNVGPTSDLQQYENTVGLMSAHLWMYIWLLLVLIITGFNIISLIRKSKQI